MELSDLGTKIMEPHTSVAVDYSPVSQRMVITLAGGIGQVGMPMDVLARTLGGLPSKRIFLRDLQRMYYLFGVVGIGNDLEQIAAWIRQQVDEQKISHLTTFGNCMGAHAAIVLGVLAEADVIHAFYPKTTIKLHHRLAFRDFPKQHLPKDMLLRTNFQDVGNWKYLDLKSFLRKHADFKGKIIVYADPEKRLTMVHANRLRDFPQVSIRMDMPSKADILGQV